MSTSELQDYTFVAKYARWIPEKKRRETWRESVDRVMNMMYEKYPEVNGDIAWAYDMMYKKRILGSQRALQFGGKPIFKHNARMYNCIASYIDRLRFFQECMYLLLCGCGTGFSVQKHHVEKLPSLIRNKSGTKKVLISFVKPLPIAGSPVFEAIILENLSGSSAITLKPTIPPQS